MMAMVGKLRGCYAPINAAALLLTLAAFGVFAHAAEIDYPGLPATTQVEASLSQHILVLNAERQLRVAQAQQRNWNSGDYEFNLRAGSAQRHIASTGQNLKEWDVALERPLRWLNKAGIDRDIGHATVAAAEYAFGDARHEAARSLLRLWFAWQQEQAQADLWQQQQSILQQQARMAEQRFKAGDAPKLQLNQALAASAQAGVAQQQAALRAQLARNVLQQQFPAIKSPETTESPIPRAIEQDLSYWQEQVMGHNHEVGVAEQQRRVQQLLAQRSRADQVPDPTVGMRYGSDLGGTEKVVGIYVSMPLSFGQRGAKAESAMQQAAMAADQELYVKQRLQADIYAAYTQAVKSYQTWQQAKTVAEAMRDNAELVAKAYSLGESSQSDSLSAHRLALEASLSETLAKLDANEARYRLLLDAHQLWPLDVAGEDETHGHY